MPFKKLVGSFIKELQAGAAQLQQQQQPRTASIRVAGQLVLVLDRCLKPGIRTGSASMTPDSKTSTSARHAITRASDRHHTKLLRYKARTAKRPIALRHVSLLGQGCRHGASDNEPKSPARHHAAATRGRYCRA